MWRTFYIFYIWNNTWNTRRGHDTSSSSSSCSRGWHNTSASSSYHSGRWLDSIAEYNIVKRLSFKTPCISLSLGHHTFQTQIKPNLGELTAAPAEVTAACLAGAVTAGGGPLGWFPGGGPLGWSPGGWPRDGPGAGPPLDTFIIPEDTSGVNKRDEDWRASWLLISGERSYDHGLSLVESDENWRVTWRVTDTGFRLVESDHMIWILASHWSRMMRISKSLTHSMSRDLISMIIVSEMKC